MVVEIIAISDPRPRDSMNWIAFAFAFSKLDVSPVDALMDALSSRIITIDAVVERPPALRLDAIGRAMHSARRIGIEMRRSSRRRRK